MGKRILAIVSATFIAAVALGTLFGWIRPAAAEGVIIVNPGESIQAAIDGATAGDTILIMAGTYTESLTLNKPVSLTGVSSATTILRAEPQDRVLTVTGATITGQVVISGLMITGGDVVSLTGGDNNRGGGVLLLDYAWPSFYHVTFFNNRAFNGGGLREVGPVDGPILFDHTVFISNTAVENFGAMAVGQALVVGGRFENNHCTHSEGCYGGAIGAEDLTMVGTTLISNSATNIGGAVFGKNITATNSLFAYNECVSTPNCHAGAVYAYRSLVVSGTTFMSNTAADAGGATVNFSTTKIINSHFMGNQCINKECDGGGVWAGGWVTISGTTFSNNMAGEEGGALYAWQPDAASLTPGSGAMTATAVLVNNLFVDNTAGFAEGMLHFENGVVEIVHNTIVATGLNQGNGIYFYNSVATITNTIITSHTYAVRVGPFTFVSEDYNLYFDNFTVFSGEVNNGGSSIFGDPDFVDPAVGDYHLGPGSAALDNALDLGVLFDLDGILRPQGCGPDRGAYEAMFFFCRIYLPVIFKS